MVVRTLIGSWLKRVTSTIHLCYLRTTTERFGRTFLGERIPRRLRSNSIRAPSGIARPGVPTHRTNSTGWRDMRTLCGRGSGRGTRARLMCVPSRRFLTGVSSITGEPLWAFAPQSPVRAKSGPSIQSQILMALGAGDQSDGFEMR